MRRCPSRCSSRTARLAVSTSSMETEEYSLFESVPKLFVNEQQTKGTVTDALSSDVQLERPPRNMRPRSFFSRSIIAPRAISSSAVPICCMTIV